MIQELWWTGMWVIAGGSGQPFKWTVTVNGLNGRNVIAEASLAKLAITDAGGGKYAKATVWHMANMGGTSWNWGMDGAPMRYLANVSYMTFALEVAGSSTYAWMNGKLYVV
jgi:hypothetical protein